MLMVHDSILKLFPHLALLLKAVKRQRQTKSQHNINGHLWCLLNLLEDARLHLLVLLEARIVVDTRNCQVKLCDLLDCQVVEAGVHVGDYHFHQAGR